MSKVIIINSCATCPFIRNFLSPDKRYCCMRKIMTSPMEMTYSMKNPYRIPRWCPLEDYDREKEEGK